MGSYETNVMDKAYLVLQMREGGEVLLIGLGS